MAKVLNMRNQGITPGAVYVGRPSKWGNPFNMGPQATRAEVMEAYRLFILSKPELQDAARRELRGKDLVCWCAPLACHADLLLTIANE